MPDKKLKTVEKKLKNRSSRSTSSVQRTGRSARVSKRVETKRVERKETAIKVSKKSALSARVHDREGKVIGEVELPERIFGAKVNSSLMAQAVRVYLANQRRGTASVKTRGEVRGSTRKIYRQKGTGRARHGAIRAPIFVGGGIAFGPKPRDYSLELPKKMKRRALFSALSQKLRENKIMIIDEVDNMEAKTKKMLAVLSALQLLDKKKKADSVLLVLPEKQGDLELSTRNIEGLELEKARNLHTYEVLKHRHILMLRDSIMALEHTFLNTSQGEEVA